MILQALTFWAEHIPRLLRIDTLLRILVNCKFIGHDIYFFTTVVTDTVSLSPTPEHCTLIGVCHS